MFSGPAYASSTPPWVLEPPRATHRPVSVEEARRIVAEEEARSQKHHRIHSGSDGDGEDVERDDDEEDEDWPRGMPSDPQGLNDLSKYLNAMMGEGAEEPEVAPRHRDKVNPPKEERKRRGEGQAEVPGLGTYVEKAGGKPNVNTLIQLMTLQAMGGMMKKLQAQDGGDEGMEGLKVLKTMSRMRAMKGNVKLRPQRLVDEYEAHWEETLGAEGKPWTWRDVARHIQWGQYTTMLRVFVMLGGIKARMEKGRTQEAEALTVQCMKASHQFALDGSWKAAWPLTTLADPVGKVGFGGTEQEMEAVLAWIKTEEDLQKRNHKIGGEGDEEPKRTRKPKKGDKIEG